MWGGHSVGSNCTAVPTNMGGGGGNRWHGVTNGVGGGCYGVGGAMGWPMAWGGRCHGIMGAMGWQMARGGGCCEVTHGVGW